MIERPLPSLHSIAKAMAAAGSRRRRAREDPAGAGAPPQGRSSLQNMTLPKLISNLRHHTDSHLKNKYK